MYKVKIKINEYWKGELSEIISDYSLKKSEEQYVETNFEDGTRKLSDDTCVMYVSDLIIFKNFSDLRNFVDDFYKTIYNLDLGKWNDPIATFKPTLFEEDYFELSAYVDYRD